MVNWHPLKPFGTLWKVQVYIYIYNENIYHICIPSNSLQTLENPSKKEAQILFELMLCEVLVSQRASLRAEPCSWGGNVFFVFFLPSSGHPNYPKVAVFASRKSRTKAHLGVFGNHTNFIFGFTHVFGSRNNKIELKWGKRMKEASRKWHLSICRV